MVPCLVAQASIAEPRQSIRFITLISPSPTISCSWRRKSASALMKKVVWPLSPKARLRTRCDNKIETVRIGNKAGVPSVPNTLSEIRNYPHLRQECDKDGIGQYLVL